ncbi:MAG: pilus assembly protein PilM [Planctomycetota bacterium]|nr:pilus assembly protein PilM [Planctomycetota bacterium]
MPRTITGIDMGSRTVKAVRGYAKGNTFVMTDFAVKSVVAPELTDGWKGLAFPFKPGDSRVGLSGRDVNVRYVRVPRVPDWQLRKLMRFEVEEIGGQSGAEVASDFNLLPELPEIEGEDVCLLAMARESLLEAHAEGLARIGGRLDAFTPNAIALYNAFLRFGAVEDEVVLLANIGWDNTDVVIARGPDLIFARNLSGGSRLVDDAISQRLDLSAAKAVDLKQRLVDLDPAARFADPNAERASRAAQAAAGQLLSLLQSAVLFSKSQVKISGLKLDRVLLCGGGAALKGLPRYLSSGMSVPVELFDPFRVVDTTRLAPEARDELEARKLESVVALGLAATAADPAAYGIEILPAALKKKREFLGGTVWLIAAGVLAAGFLGWEAWRTKTELDAARARAAQLEQQYKKASSTHRKAEELATENARLAKLSHELFATKGSGEQVARTLDWMKADLPREFWVTQLSSDVRADPDLGIQRGQDKPIVSVVGQAREGTNALPQLYESFLQKLRARLPEGVTPKEKLAPNGARFTLDLSLFAPPAGAPSPAGEGAKKP